jgi:hypothetical protein
MTDAHLGILRAVARSRARRLAADGRPLGAAEGPATKRRSDLERRSVQARRQLSRAQARRGPTRGA